jgi:hypothetical protein
MKINPIPRATSSNSTTARVFPGDLDLTLNWKPETELTIVPSDDDVSSHMLMGGGAKVHVISAGESWPVKEVKSILKEG